MQPIPEDSPPGVDDNYVILPELFVHFVSKEPPINIYYQLVQEESNNFMMKTLNLNANQFRKPLACDCSMYAALHFPDASAARLRTCADWIQWVFVFDDRQSFPDAALFF
jgi:hypothetical protein